MHTYIHTNSTELVSSSILRIEQRMNISQNATTTKVVCVCITCEYYKNTEQNKWSFLPVFTEKKLIFSLFFPPLLRIPPTYFLLIFPNIPISFSVSLLDYVQYVHGWKHPTWKVASCEEKSILFCVKQEKWNIFLFVSGLVYTQK